MLQQSITDALQFAAEHPKLIKGLFEYVIFSNAVSTMPSPRKLRDNAPIAVVILSELYLWAFRLLHVLAMNAGRVVATWAPQISKFTEADPSSSSTANTDPKSELEHKEK